MVKIGSRFGKVILSAGLAITLGLYTCAAFAYTPQGLYDNVWKLVDNKYVDSADNGQQWSRWRHKYDDSIKSEQDAYVAIDTMLSSLNDPYTKFLDPDEFSEETRSISGNLEGIGVQIGTRDGKLLVISPIEDTPAFKAGLQANDEIVEIDGNITKGITVKDAANLIRGERGTKVKLLVKRGTTEKLYVIARENIKLKSVSYKTPETFKLNPNVGYIKLNSFLNSSASDEISQALAKYKDKNGYILDLRSNPGGLLTNAIYIADMFLNGGTIVSTVDRDGYKETQRCSGNYVTNKPLVVLINEGSASASEILSGALKDNGRAILVGHKSFGKGLVQEINRLPGGSGLNITIQKYLTPNGTDINKVGITPDIIVDITEQDAKANKDPQLEKAQEALLDLMQGKTAEKTINLDKNNLPVNVQINR